MSEPASGKEMEVRSYSAPTLKVYGSVTRLTASGTGSALESSGGTCGVTPSTKQRC